MPGECEYPACRVHRSPRIRVDALQEGGAIALVQGSGARQSTIVGRADAGVSRDSKRGQRFGTDDQETERRLICGKQIQRPESRTRPIRRPG